MTGRAIQKIWVSKVMNVQNNDASIILGDVRSDLLAGQQWNVRVNDLMIYDRDVNNRAEEFNYLQQTGEAQYTIPPSMFEKRSAGTGDRVNYTAGNDDAWVSTINTIATNVTTANTGGGPQHPVAVSADVGSGEVGKNSVTKQGASVQVANVREQLEGRMNYLAINLARYKSGGDSPMNAMRIGSTPIVFQLTRNGAGDADTTQQTGTAYFWVEYLKMMNLKNGQISVMDM